MKRSVSTGPGLLVPSLWIPLFLMLLLPLAGTLPAVAGELRLSVMPTSGATQYQIAVPGVSDSDPGGASLLRFPVSATLVNLSYTYPLEPWVELRSEVSAAIPGESGALSDYDWIDDLSQVDIYSESSLRLDTALTWDIGLGAARRGVGPTVGVRRQQYRFSATDVRQVGFGSYSNMTGFIPGPVINYEAAYTMPYAGVSVAGGEGGFDYALELRFSPHVTARDTDVHLLRDKIGLGESAGSGWTIGGRATFALGANTYVEGSVGYVAMQTSGAQYQYFVDSYGTPDPVGYVPQWLDLNQLSYGVSLKRRF